MHPGLKATCSVVGCERPAEARGWCKQHYKRWLRTGEVGPAQFKAKNPGSICSVEGCNRPAKVRGWCPLHYSRWRKLGSPVAPLAKNPRMGICGVGGCGQRDVSRGWCSGHYRRWRLYGDPLGVGRQPRGICSVDGCEEPHQARGLCRDHYQKWRLYGDALAVRPPNGKAKQFCKIPSCGRSVNRNDTGLCSMHQWRLDHHGEAQWEPLKPGEDRPCARCGVVKHPDELIRHPTGVGGRGSVCRECKKSYDAEYRVTNAGKRRESHARRRALTRGVGSERLSVAALWARDDGICALCGEAVDVGLKYPNPRSWSIDHVMPLSLGGQHRMDNVRITHLDCNVRRGAARGESIWEKHSDSDEEGGLD